MNAKDEEKTGPAVRYGQASAAGLKAVNEDCLGIRLPDDDTLETKGFAVIIADGVSAAEAGREASEICVQAFLGDYFSTPETWQVKTAVHRVLSSLNRWLFGKGQAFAEAHRGYVCAMSAVVVKSHSAHVFHVGDTRVYRFSDDTLEPLTKDHHTWVSSDTRYLARAMGMDLNLNIDYRRVAIEAGNTLFLCTDGVHDFVTERELREFLGTDDEDLDAVCEAILARALENGSADNLSCQIVRLDRLNLPAAADVYAELGRLPFPPPLEPGMNLDGYVVEKILEESSRSQLYLVGDQESGERWVMKTPAPRFSDAPAYIERFIMEEWIGTRVSSSHLVRVIPKRQTPRFLFYLMEHVRGQTLSEWIRVHPQPEIGTVVEMVRQMIDGLRALHRRETFHQDLKPDNIILGPDQWVKIIDFGSAYVAGIHETHVPFERKAELGTRKYSAPEYALGRAPSTRSDLFSLAVVTYELLTGGAHPFGPRFEEAETVRDFMTLTYQPASKRNPLVPSWIDAALEKALSTNPDRRQEVLSEFLTDLSHPNPSLLKGEDSPLLERRPVLFWKAVSALLATVVVLLLVLLAKP